VSIQIVGIMADGKYFTLSEDPQSRSVLPELAERDTSTALIVRTRRDTADMVAAIREVVRDLDRAVPIRELSPWNTQLALSFFPSQVATVASASLALLDFCSRSPDLRPRLVYGQQAAARVEYSCRTRCQARQILSAALGRMLILLGSGSVIGIVLGVRQAGYSRPSSISLRTGSIGACRCRIHYRAYRIPTVAGPVRRVLHADPTNLSANNNFKPDLAFPFECARVKRNREQCTCLKEFRDGEGCVC